MPEVHREDRLAAIREILGRRSVRRQDDLVARLRRRGFEVTQSSVSRDLRELQVAKVGGEYVLPSDGADEPPVDASLPRTLATFVQEVLPAGPNLLVVKTVIGGASRVGLAIDQASWPEVVGTVAGDDSLFVATPGLREQKRVLQRLRGRVKES